MANFDLLKGMIEESAKQEQQDLLDLQQLSFAMGQNAATAANLNEQGTFNANLGAGSRTETALSARVRMQEELLAQQRKAEFADNIDYGALSFEIAAKTQETVRQNIQLAEKIRVDSSVGLFDDPLMALANAFTLPWDQQKLEAGNQKLKVLQDASDKLNSQTTHFAKTTDELKQSLTQASIDDVSRGLATEMKARSLIEHNKALEYNAKQIEWGSKANHTQLTAQREIYKLQNEEESRKALAEQRQFIREQREQASERAEEILKDRRASEADKAAAKAYKLADIEIVKDELRKQPGMILEDGSLKISDAEIQRGLEAKIPMLVELRDRGFVSKFQGRASFGETPLERDAYMRATGVMIQNDGQELLAKANSEALKVASGEKDKNAKGTVAQTYINTKFDAWQRNVGNGSKENPLALRTYEELALTDAVRTNPAYALIKDLAEGERTKNTQIDMQLIFDKLIPAVGNKTIDIRKATELITDIANVNAHYNAVQHKVFDFTGRDQTTAIVKVKMRPIAGEAMAEVGTGMTVAGLATGNLPFAAVGAGIGATGALMQYSKKDVNIMDGVAVRAALVEGVAAQMKYSLNTSGKYPEGHRGFYPPKILDNQVGAR
jgi:hypothetical protein